MHWGHTCRSHYAILIYILFDFFIIVSDGVRHRVYNSQSMTDSSDSRLEVMLLEEANNFVSYTCIGMNSEGKAEDKVVIEVEETQPKLHNSPKENEIETRVELWDTDQGKCFKTKVSLVNFANLELKITSSRQREQKNIGF